MNASHSPPRPPPRKNRRNPNMMKATAMDCPILAAIFVARIGFPFTPQIIDRKTRPPSSGNPGIILNTASETLMYPSHTRPAHKADGGRPECGCQPATCAMPRKNNPITALVIGPTIAIQNSDFASADSFSILATPPSANKVIDLTGIPRAFATAAWDNSCATMLAKNKSPVIAARDHVNPKLHCGFTMWKCADSESTINNAITNQL